MATIITPRRGVGDPDATARMLAYCGRFARSLPPAWDGAAISIPVMDPGLGCHGLLLPGRGFYLDMDLRELGITRRGIPHVFPASPIKRLMDQYAEALHRCGIGVYDPVRHAGIVRATITTYDGIVAARAAGKDDDILLTKVSITTVADQWSSLWQAGGSPPGAGGYTAIPGGAAHNRATTGAWSLGLRNPTAPDRKYLLTLGYMFAQTHNAILLVDLLVGAGSISANTAAAQTINSTALTRYTGGAGVFMTFEVTTALGATASNLTVTSYTNQAGTAGRSTPAVAMTTSAIVSRLQPVALGPHMELQSGDFGVRSVETLQLSAAMGAGVFALNLYFPLTFVPGIALNVYVERDSTIQIDGFKELVTEGGGSIGALVAYLFPDAATSGTGNFFMRACEG